VNSSCNRICVTPVRNEAWIIKQFVDAAKSWATHVIVADQKSTDGTLQLLQQTPGVDVLINDSPVFEESHRQRLLLNRAREIPGKRILIGLDADEAISANFSTSEEWRRLEFVEPGTIIRFRWVNVLPGFEQVWMAPEPVAIGFVDDGSEHKGGQIHSPRVPNPTGAPVLDMEETVVLHFQYVAWDRMVSKQRWYQAWEHAVHRQKSALRIFREYHHMHGGWEKNEIQPMRPEWLQGYSQAGVDYRALKGETVTWWDREVLQMLAQYGLEHFRRIDLWDKNWNAVAELIGTTGHDFQDPRSQIDKTIHRLLNASQGHRSNLLVRAFERSLRMAGW